MHILRGIYWTSLIFTLSAVAMLALDERTFTNLVFNGFRGVDRFGSSLIDYVMTYNLDVQFELMLQTSLPKKDKSTGSLGPLTSSSDWSFLDHISSYTVGDAADMNELTIGPQIRLALYRGIPTHIDSIRGDFVSTLERLVVVIDRDKLQFPLSDSYDCSRKLFSGDFKRRTTKLYHTYFPLAESPAICAYLSAEQPIAPTIADALEQMRLLEEPMRFDLLRVSSWFVHAERNGTTYASFDSSLSPPARQLVWDQLQKCAALRKANDFGCDRDIPFDGSLTLDTSAHLLETFWRSRTAPEDFTKYAERYIHAVFNGADPLVKLDFFLTLSDEPIIVTLRAIESQKYRETIEDFTRRGSFLLDGTAPLIMESAHGWWDFYWANLIKAMQHYKIAIGKQGVSVWTALMLMILATSALMTWKRVKATVSAEID